MGETRVKLTATQRYIGDNLLKGTMDYPQAFTVTKARMDNLLAYKNSAKEQGVHVTMGAFFAKAISVVLQKYPKMNCRKEGREMIIYDDINVGVAMSAGDHLMVCVVKQTQDKTVSQLSAEMREFKKKIVENKLTHEDISGGTITMSSLGDGRSNIPVPLVTNGECLMIGIGSTLTEPAIMEDNTIGIGKFINIAVNSNHYLTNGINVSQFCDFICEVIEHPEIYLPL